MLPLINGKPIIECTEQDLVGMIDDSNYCENEYLDYKSEFSASKFKPNDENRKKALAEFRSDICSFANAEGGYLIYGIREEKGVPVEVSGFDVNNDDTDKLELNIKNYLQPIQPRMPNCSFHFVRLENGRFVMVILVRHDAFAPYIHIENEKDYRIYKRSGNSKSTIAYSELRNMFVQSLALEKEIERFREERINFYKRQGNKRFMLVHIIPDTFMDSSYNKLVYVLNHQRKNELISIFSEYRCSYSPLPMVDGLRLLPSTDFYNHEGRIFNNCIAELFDSLLNEVEPINDGSQEFERLYYEPIWGYAVSLIKNYLSIMQKNLQTKRIFVCISILGCKDVHTEKDFSFISMKIDRDAVLMEPCVFEGFEDSNIEQCTRRMRLNYLLALGITRNSDLKELFEEFQQ